MAIVAGDILIKLSTKAGAAGNTLTSTPATALGKYLSTTEITDASANNLFDDVSALENEALTVEYRCFFVHNAHASLTYQGPLAYVYSEVSGGCALAIAVDSVAASAIGSSSAQALEVANDATAPDAIVFSTPTTAATGLALGDIPAGQCKAVWVRRTAANTTAVNNDGGVIRVLGGTAA